MSGKSCQIVPRSDYTVEQRHPGGQPAGGLSVAQQRAIEALVGNATVVAAAVECGVSKRTLFRWLREPEFQKAFRRLQYAVVTQAHACLQGITADAVETLRELMNNREVPAGARVSACRATLTLAYDLIQAEDIQNRLETLERLRASSPATPY